jgi:flagellin-like protein
MCKILRSKKGISPILATLLLIVIAVAAIIVTYAWVMTFMGAQTTAGGTLLKVENVGPWHTENTTIAVKNIGTSQAKIVRLYAGTTAESLTEVTDDTDLGSTGANLPVDQKIDIVLSWPNNATSFWTKGTTYYFSIVPEEGAELEFTARAPSN